MDFGTNKSKIRNFDTKKWTLYGYLLGQSYDDFFQTYLKIIIELAKKKIIQCSLETQAAKRTDDKAVVVIVRRNYIHYRDQIKFVQRRAGGRGRSWRPL